MDKDRREQLVLTALLERRLSVEEEARHLRVRAIELTRGDAELRDEIAALDAILGARVEPPPAAPSVPTALTVAATPAEVTPPAPSESTTKRKRRRKGSRREEMLPAMRAKFGTGPFDTEAVTELIVQAEGGEHRKAYFAAWSLVRDLAEDGVVEVASEEGEGKRKRRTYRFAGPSAREGLSVQEPEEAPPGLEREILRFVKEKKTVRAEELLLRFHGPPPETLANAVLFLEKRGDIELIQGPIGVAVGERIIARVSVVDRAQRTAERNEAFVARLTEARRRDLERSQRGSNSGST